MNFCPSVRSKYFLSLIYFSTLFFSKSSFTNRPVVSSPRRRFIFTFRLTIKHRLVPEPDASWRLFRVNDREGKETHPCADQCTYEGCQGCGWGAKLHIAWINSHFSIASWILECGCSQDKWGRNRQPGRRL